MSHVHTVGSRHGEVHEHPISGEPSTILTDPQAHPEHALVEPGIRFADVIGDADPAALALLSADSRLAWEEAR